MIKNQIKDAQECAEMAEHGKDKDCLGCSCNVCLAQAPKMFNHKELILIKYAIENYKKEAYSILLKTDDFALEKHNKAQLDVDESNELLKRIEGLLNEI